MKTLTTTISPRNSTRIQSAYPLSDEQIFSVAPSIYAPNAHESRSKRYAYIPTANVLDSLRNEGFQPFFAAQSVCRVPGKSEFTKHMLRLRHVDNITASDVNEIILINSHDGTSSYQLLAGVFRFVCTNGMVCGSITDDIRIKHTGNVINDVIEGSYRVLSDFDRVDQSKDTMKSITLNPSEQRLLANAALELRYGETDENNNPLPLKAPIQAEQLLNTRRWEDRPNDLWATFNTLQENLIQGGIRGRPANGRRQTTRPVNGIDNNIKLNRALWALAEGMAALKQ